MGAGLWGDGRRVPFLGRLALLAMDRDPLKPDDVLGSCGLGLRECLLQARRAALQQAARGRVATQQVGSGGGGGNGGGGKGGGSRAPQSPSRGGRGSGASSRSGGGGDGGYVGAWRFRRDLTLHGVAHGELRGTVHVSLLDGATGQPLALGPHSGPRGTSLPGPGDRGGLFGSVAKRRLRKALHLVHLSTSLSPSSSRNTLQ
jgi:hypothetical protein